MSFKKYSVFGQRRAEDALFRREQDLLDWERAKSGKIKEIKSSGIRSKLAGIVTANIHEPTRVHALIDQKIKAAQRDIANIRKKLGKTDF